MADIQNARQTRAVAEMARSVDLPEELKAKLEDPRPGLLTTIGRVIESSVGQKRLMVQMDADHGLRGTTTKTEFVKGFSRLVTDVTLGKESSRSLNTTEDIERYFGTWDAEELPKKKRGSWIPADIIDEPSVASPRPAPRAKPKRPPRESMTVLPKDLKARYCGTRIAEIRDELTKLKRDEFPNAGAVLLRVFFELAVMDYLERTGDLADLTATLEKKQKLRYGKPEMKHIRERVISIAKDQLSRDDATTVSKALSGDRSAPFGLDDLHAFVHQAKEFPVGRDILQFWSRTEPLFRLMLEEPAGDEKV